MLQNINTIPNRRRWHGHGSRLTIAMVIIQMYGACATAQTQASPPAALPALAPPIAAPQFNVNGPDSDRIVTAIRELEYYPPAAKRKSLQGRVEISFEFDSAGSPKKLVIERTDYKVLNSGAETYVKNLRLRGSDGGAPRSTLPARLRMTVMFVLDREPAPTPWDTSIPTMTIRGASITLPANMR